MSELTVAPVLSIVVPMYNEEEMVRAFLDAVRRECDPLSISYEIVAVDDGSRDATFALLTAAADDDDRIKVVRLSRNFGHQAAFNAGIDCARGSYVVTMDGDLQHPPALIPKFVELADAGRDLVIGERLDNAQNSALRELAGRLFYGFMSRATNLEFRNSSDFALYKRSVIDVFKRLPERERFLRGMFQWVGFDKAYVPYHVGERFAGVPKYTVKRLVALVMSGVTSFSAVPLRLSLWIGLALFCVNLCLLAYFAVEHLLVPDAQPTGFATLVVLILGLSSVHFILLGIVGEYLFKMFNELKGRPFYVVRDVQNLDPNLVRPGAYGVVAQPPPDTESR